MKVPVDPETREELIQVLANLDELIDTIGVKKMEEAGALKSSNKIYQILNGLVASSRENKK